MSNKKPLDRVLVVDVESTCWNAEEREQARWPLTNEIIEIGLAEVDIRSLTIVSNRSILIRPAFSSVGKFCTELTTLTQEQVDDGIALEEACWILRDEYQSDRRVWASWGDYDRTQFEQCCRRVCMRYPFGTRHLNIKTMFGLMRNLAKEVSVETACSMMQVRFGGTRHRGVDDARNIAELFVRLIERNTMSEETKATPGPLVEDTTVAGGVDEATGAPVIKPKTPDGKAPSDVKPTDRREGADSDE